MSKINKYESAIYDARTLGKMRMLILGVQHMFAMFGAAILVPILVNHLYISTNNRYFIRWSFYKIDSETFSVTNLLVTLIVLIFA